MSTTKRDLVKKIATKTGNKQYITQEIIQTFLDEIIAELAKGNRMEFREFGVFDVATKKARIARNPRTGEAVEVPEKCVVNFKVGRSMREKVLALAKDNS